MSLYDTLLSLSLAAKPEYDVTITQRISNEEHSNMNSQWQAFLHANYALLSDDQGHRFPDAPPFPETALFDLSHLGLIRVAGEDAEGFLQGQFSNDTREITDTHSQLSAYCSPKGRVLASFRLFQRDEAIYLQQPKDTHGNLLKRLPMFILMSKVEVSDASDELIRIGIAGTSAEKALKEQFSKLPEATLGAAIQDGDFTVIRMPGATPRFEIVSTPDSMQTLWEKLVEHAAPANIDYWRLLEIQAGTPTIYQENIEAFVPQMTNLQLIDGVSFTKGCYTGQEVVARMKYLGKLKRRMYRAHVENETCPKPGDALFSPTSASNQGAGKVVDAAPAPNGGFELLVVTENSVYEQDSLHLSSENGPKLSFQPLPYAFDSA